MRRLLLLLLLALPFAAEAKKPPPPPPAAWNAGDLSADDYSAAFTALNGKKYADAEAGFNAILAREPECGLALLGLGRALTGDGKAADAIAPLQKAATTFPDHIEPQLALGHAYEALHQPDNAFAAAQAALKLKPTNIEATAIAQGVLIDQKKFAEAHQMIADARAVSNVVAYNCFDGLVYVAEQNWDKAKGMLPQCEGVPDAALYQRLADAVAAAPPPPPPAPPPAAPPPPPEKSTKSAHK